jgi:PKD repeat protein
MVIDRLGRRMSSSNLAACAAPLDRKPVAKIAPLPALVLVNQPTRFDASASFDPDEFPLTYRWTFGDGSAASPTSTAAVQHTYSQVGTYTATLVVNDGVIDSDPLSITVTVRDASVLLPILQLLLDD